MEVLAQYRQARTSAQKIRLVANLIRKKTVQKALCILDYSPKKSAFIVKKSFKISHS